jgi:hypothetical protein
MLLPGYDRELDLLALQSDRRQHHPGGRSGQQNDSDDGEKEQLEEVFAHQSGAADRLRGWEVRTNFDWPYNSRKPRG